MRKQIVTADLRRVESREKSAEIRSVYASGQAQSGPLAV